MTLLQTLVVLCGVLNLTFGAFLFLNSGTSRNIKLYALIYVFATLWAISTLLTSVGGLTVQYLQLALDGHYIFGFLAYFSFFWFALLYPTTPKRPLMPAIGLSVAVLTYLFLLPTTNPIFSLQAGNSLAQRVLFIQPTYNIFIIFLSFTFFVGLFILLRIRSTVDRAILYKDLNEYQIYFAILTNFVAGVLGITFNLLFPLYGNFDFFYINPIFVMSALLVIGLYNVLRYDFFNARIILSEFFTGGIIILSLTRLIFSPAGPERIIDAVLLGIMLIFGFFLIQSIFREVRLREQIQKQEKELEAANAAQESLLHFISHEIKGYLAKSEAGFAAIAEGDYGAVSDELRGMAQLALSETRKGVETVMSILDASNLKKGTVAFEKKPFDLKAAMLTVVDDLKDAAEKRHVAVHAIFPPTGPIEVVGDEAKIRQHIIRNLIDNAIKYTPAGGSIEVAVGRGNGVARFETRDSGVGITPDDMRRLFTEGGRGKDSLKVNVHSTGYGLYIAKQVVEAHDGRIWAESEGGGKGSRFVVELPANK